MSPAQHLDWLEDNIGWFAAIPLDKYDVDVPSCPGWNIEKVVNHLAIGLGLAYPHALDAPPDMPADQAWADVDWPTTEPSGHAARELFIATMTGCLNTYRDTDPDMACWTYAGPGAARFWFRRAAIETTLHRFDVAEALGSNDLELAADRAEDGVAEAVEFALPIAAILAGHPTSAVEITIDGVRTPFQLGEGTPAAKIAGSGKDVLATLWGRHRDGVTVNGEADAAQQWLTLVETAFAGR